MRFRRTKDATGRDRHREVVVALAVALLASWLGNAGCSPVARDEAGESDANGYVCSKCEAKFYTERDLFAERCPSCQAPEIKTVVGFVCEKDQHMIIGPSGRDSIPCDQCSSQTTALRLPKESELKAWGAEKKSRHQVTLE